MTNDFFQISVDTGGTFTDCIAIAPNGQIKTCKVLSNSSLRGSITEWIDSKTLRVQNNWQVERDIFQNYEFRILNHSNLESLVYKMESYDWEQKIIYLNQSLPIDFQGLKLSYEITACQEAPILAARLITQTALDEVFPPLKMRIGSTKGTNALLERKGAKTGFIVTKGFKDLLTIKNQQRSDLFALNIRKSEPMYAAVAEIEERLNADGSVFKSLIINDLNKIIRRFKKQQITSVAVALMHSYRNPKHEILIKNVLERHFEYVSIASELSQQIKFVPRAETTVVNAYLAPILDDYMKNIVAKCPDDSLQVITSAGSLVQAKQFYPKDSLLGALAGGIIGAATVGRQSGFHQLISFDCGGTSCDIARFDNDFDYKFDVTIGDATVFSPALAIETIAAGGGSITFFDGYKLCVGPESAGAVPGPASYGAGGPLTITDVHLLLGRLDTSQFGIPIFKEAAVRQLDLIQAEIAEKTRKIMSKEAILQGFLDIANERMADAIKKISIAKGYSPAQYALIAFGGAGGLHAADMAKILNMDTVLLPQHAGLLSAYGILNAQIERFAEKQILKTVSQISWEALEQAFQTLSQNAIQKIIIDGAAEDKIYIKKQIMYCRLKGQDATLECDFDKDFQKHFKTKYENLYGHWIDNRAIEIESIRVIAAEKADFQQVTLSSIENKSYVPTPHHFTKAFVNNQWQTIPVFFRNDLKMGASLEGFALVLDHYSTTVVEEGFNFTINDQNTAVMKRIKNIQINKNSQTETIDLELFTNRFMNIAENMGVLLQRTALSVNVKERLDFSCALLDANGFLIANAPNIPVHLGSLGVCVRTVLKDYILKDGDTIITNHPAFGGSHLPDVTLITPVYTLDKKLIGYVCNRCHHSEIGGIRPASMPPNATRLVEEGVVIAPMYLVKNGVIDWKSIRCKLTESIYPSRSVEENIADLNAALAANLNGVQALQALVQAQGLEKVHFYMDLLQQYSADKLKDSLMRQFSAGDYEATEKLDDGTLLKVKISLGEQVIFDFTGTASVHQGNLNASPAIVNSVVIYVLRLLLQENIPLNEGLMRNVILILPKNSILNPDFSSDPTLCPAVVGGNVETSQRLTDTLLKALGVSACGQGTMNNTLFGNETYGYYETICGGAGATNGFQGADAVHSHMTNTRITDPEVMELRYPVRLDEFSVRKNSGGKGFYRGGDGIVRKITFLAPVELSILSQHRIIAPYGLKGGQNGKRGKQFLVLKDKTIKILGGNAAATVEIGEQLVMQTPGGGGYGKHF